MMTAEEIRLRNLKRRRILISSIALVIFFIGGFFGARPSANAIKAWQARRHAAKAFGYIEKEDWLEARKETTAAYQLRPTEPQALRAVARFLSRTQQPDALEFWQRLEEVAPLTREDRQDEAAIAIMAGETARAELAVNALVESQGADPAGWLLAAQLSIHKGATDDAIAALRKVFDDPRTTEQQQLQAAVLELSLASEGDVASELLSDAWPRIEKISKGKSGPALDALMLLAQQSVTQSPNGIRPIAMTSEEIRRAIENHPLAKAPQKLLALDLLEHVDPSRRDELIAKGIAQWKGGGAEDLFALATWLNSKNEFKKTLAAIPLDKALLSRTLFLQYLDALGGLDRWNDVKQLLESGRYPLDPVVEDMYLARCNAQLGEKTAAQNNWQRALEAAAGDTGKLMTLAEYAEKNGMVDVARQAFDAVATEAPRLRVAQQGRLRIAQRSRDTRKIHAVLAEMLKVWPDDDAVENDEGYTRLLLLLSKAAEVSGQKSDVREPLTNNEELITLSVLAEKLFDKNPRSLPHRTFLALVRLKQNRSADALAVYDNISVAPNVITPSALAVHTAVLAANGRVDEAQREARQIKIETLLPEEKQLIDGLRHE